METPTLTPNPTKDDLQRRIVTALNILSYVPALPDAGKHTDPTCHSRHRDCLAAKLRSALMGSDDY